MLGGETVQLCRWSGKTKNAHGQLVDAWDEAVDVEDVGVDAPVVSEPRDGNAHDVRYDYALYLPAGTTVGDRDRVIVRGITCTVERPGGPMQNMFTGALFRTEVTVRRVT